ncbi:hypothetical protein ACH5RR_040898, partial [Cinchona calisaya]
QPATSPPQQPAASPSQQPESGPPQQFESDPPQQPESNPPQQSSYFEEWNEPVVGDEELMDKFNSNDNDDYMNFDPEIEFMKPIVELKSDIRRELMVDVSIPQVYRAKGKVKDVLNGVDMAQYHNLWSYAAIVREKKIRGSTIKMALNKPFEDSIAMGRDANESMFPLAFAIVKVECYDSWKWFLEFLIGDVAAIQVDRKKKVEDYMDDCYTKDAYLRSYAHMIHAMSGEMHWVETNEEPNQSTIGTYTRQAIGQQESQSQSTTAT